MEVKEIKEKLKAMVPSFARKVLPLYSLLGWEWSSGKTKPHIPSLGEIENTLYRLINGLTEERQSSTTGGLEAYYSWPGEYEPGHYGLRFILEEQESFKTATEGLASYIRIPEAAKRLGIHEESLRRLLRIGTLRGRKIGGQWFIDREELATFASSYEAKTGKRGHT